MKIATLLFTYCRSYHTEQVITALRKNSIMPQKLLIFQDGLNKDEKTDEWNRVNRLINMIDWCDREIIVSEYNKGLADSIIYGINYAFREYDAVIVLEDDCVPTANFLNFMQQCFEKYQNNEKVYAVSGYAWPIELPEDCYDVYGCGRTSTWGWGTWKNRWEKYTVDNHVLKHIRRDREKSRNLAVWRNDCEQTLVGNVTGRMDAWGVYWGLCVIDNDGICINPYVSLIQNIGFDGTGVHCGATNRLPVRVSDGTQSKFRLPDNIGILRTTEMAFVGFYGSYAAVNKMEKIKTRALIYGLGNFYAQNEKAINDCYCIEAFIDKRKKGWFAGKKIIFLDEIAGYSYEQIIVMIQDVQECFHVISDLLSRGVAAKNIVLGYSRYGKYAEIVDGIKILTDGRIKLFFGNVTIKVCSWDEFREACEVLYKKKYHYFINNRKRDVVIDVGTNTGVSALYFLNCEKVDRVYAYESVKSRFKAAEDNLKGYLGMNKAEIFHCGIGYENKLQQVWDSSIEQEVSVEIKKASDVFGVIVEKYSDHNIVLRISSVDEQDHILKNLLESGLLSHFKLIILELHTEKRNFVLEYLQAAGFSWWFGQISEMTELLYAYKM